MNFGITIGITQRKIIGLAVAVFIASVNPTPTWAIAEKGFLKSWQEQTLPYYFNYGQGGKLKREGSIELNYRWFPNSGPVVVVIPGRTEPAQKYAEVAYDLHQLGYSVWILDHRGQGESSRLLKNKSLGYVKHFQDFVDDLAAFMDNVVNVYEAYNSNPRFALAHSMGGAVLTLYLFQHPQTFAAVALSSPMWALQTPPYSENTAVKLSGKLVRAGLGKFKSLPRQGYEPFPPFERNEVTNSRERFKVNAQVRAITLGAPTNSWAYEALLATRKVRAHIQELKTPTLLLSADDDKIVKVSEVLKTCEKSSHCSAEPTFHAKHEILQEKDIVRDVAKKRILDWFDRYSQK